MRAILSEECKFEKIDKTASPRFLVLQKQSENMLKTFLSWTKTDTDLVVEAVYQHLNDTKIEAAFSH